MVEFKGGLSATGFGDKLRWAIYDAPEHRIRSPIKVNAPEKAINKISGHVFSPYLEIVKNDVEVQYCRQVMEWWKEAMSMKSLSNVQRPAPTQKTHLLISDASPNRPPGGFFNCTVEVRTVVI